MVKADSTDDASSLTISVALCTYNAGRFIDDQLRSILDQSRPVDEVLVSDDGSSDGTLDRVRAIAAAHPRGEVVHIVGTSRVGGVIPNFQRALSAVTGDLIALSDHDDVWRQDRVQRAVAAMPGDISRPSLVFSDARLIDDDGKDRGRSLFQAYDVSDADLAAVTSDRALEVLGWRNIVTGATVMFNRSLLEVALPLPDRWIHDEWLAVLAAALGRIGVVREPLIGYRIHGRNQIGVPPRNPLKRLFIALRVGAPRYQNLHLRTTYLLERLERDHAADEPLRLLRHRLAFEEARGRYGRVPPTRLVPILSQYRRGEYKRFTRQPLLEAVRDLLQRP